LGHLVYGNFLLLLRADLDDSDLDAEIVQILLVSEELNLDEKMMDDYRLKISLMKA